MRSEIRTPVTTSTEWTDFAKLVEAALMVEKSLVETGLIEDEIEQDKHLGHLRRSLIKVRVDDLFQESLVGEISKLGRVDYTL